VNSLKTIFSRIATLPKAEEALAGVGVSIKDSSGNMREVGDIIDDLGKKWGTLNSEAQQSVLINVAGTYQQNRLAALMNNYTMSISANESALNSQGSAMKEQERYNESLEGRINRLDTAWTSFSKTVGDTILYDGIVVVTKALEGMADGGNSVVSTIGLLPPLFGAAYTAVFLLNSGFRSLTIGMGTAVGSAISTTVATRSLTVGITSLRASVAALGVTFKSVLASTGVGLIFVGLGFAIEKLTGIMSENIQQQEKYEEVANKNTSALTDNKDRVDELIAKYNSLSDAKNSGDWSADKEKEYLKVQEDLAFLFPALVSHIDSTGQAHIKSSAAIEKEIAATEELIRLKKEETKANAEDVFKENIKSNEKTQGKIDSKKDAIAQLEKERDSGSPLYDVESKTKLITKMQTDVQMLEMQMSASTQEIVGNVLEISNAFSNIKIDSGVTNAISTFLYDLDFSNLDEAQLKSFSTELGKLMSDMQKAVNTDDAELFNKSAKGINELASKYNVADSEVNKFDTNYKNFLNTVKGGNGVVLQESDSLESFADGADGASDSVSELASKMKDYKDAAEQMAGVSQAGIDSLNDLILKYDILSYQLAGYTEQQLQDIYTKENLTSKEQDIKNILDQRVATMQEMSSVYPDLLDKDGKAIVLSDEKRKAIEAENHANEVLLNAYKLARDGKLNAEQQATLASASGAKARIQNLKVEIDMLSKYVRANQLALASATVISSLPLTGLAGDVAQMGLAAQQKAMQSNLAASKAELDTLSSSLNTNIGKIESFSAAIEDSSSKTGKNSKATQDNTKSKKENNKETEQSIYLTDKYKKKIEEVTLAIEEQNAIQATKSEHSKDYRKSLEKELALEQQKLQIMKDQSKSIDQQIKSGKIQQTGNVNVNSGSGGKIHGYDGKITSRPGERADNHRGTDIAMKTGSRVDSPVSGKVIKSGAATSDKNGKAMHWSYGNMVVVQDDQGMKHILAHLDDTLVKVGDQVEAGQQVGKSGNTGKSTGPHLHYEQNTADGKVVSSLDTVNAIRSGNKTATTSTKSNATTVSSTPETVVWNYFKNKGLSDEAVAGLMGNIKQESNFNSKAVNKSSGASGIFQWLGGRKTGLQDYAKSVGKSWTDLEVQLDYAWKEMQGKEKKSLEGLKKTNLTASQHATEFEKNFERSGGSGNKKRASAADQYYNKYKGTNGGAGVGIDTSQQAIDQAMSDLNGLNKEILNQQNNIEDLKRQLIDANLAGYENRKSNYDKTLENSEVRLSRLSDTSEEYRKELEAQTKALTAKQTENNAEIKFLEDTIKNGKLTDKTIDELNQKINELAKVNHEIDSSKLEIQNKILESYVKTVDQLINKYSELQALSSKALDYEALKLQELDSNSLRYLQSLEKMNKMRKDSQNLNRQELTYLENLIYSGKLSGESLENATARARDLRLEIKQLQLDIQEKDFEILMTIKTNSDAKLEEIQFEMNRATAIRDMFEQGTGEYIKQTQNLIKYQEQLAKQHLETRDALANELKQYDISLERRKDVEKMLREEHLAYLNAQKGLKDYQKQLEEGKKSNLNEIADKFISALKEYYQELRDEHMKSIEEMSKKETEAHEKRKKQLEDEMELFRKNVEEKLRLIDRQEADRDYNMEIDDMEKERNKLQSEFDLLSLDNSNEAKSKRKKLQEQLDQIDKDIAEKRHDRDIELQKQGLSDMLESKEEEMNGKIELEDKQYEEVMNRIDREKQYWEKHYNDLMNDEREFARIREDIMNGHLDKVVAEFQDHIERMKLTMPDLADTMDGTMQAVGMTIRQNVIDHLQEAINMVHEFNQVASTMAQVGDNFDPGSFFDESKMGQGGVSKGNLNEGDMQILLGKFLTDNVTRHLTGDAKNKAHSTGSQIGKSGRQNGGTIDKNVSFDSAISGLTPAELESLKQYFKQNSGVEGGNYSDFIRDFANNSSDYGSIESSNKHGLTNPLTYGTMQVLMAKHINESMLGQTKDANMRKQLKSTADTMAQQGRASGSTLASDASFMSMVGLMDGNQKGQMKNFMQSQVNIIPDSKMQKDFLRFVASLDTGGFMNWSGNGIDGKGGKAIIAHPNEIMLNKVDTQGFFNSINVIDRVMSSLKPMLAKFTPQPTLSNLQQSGDTYQIQFGDVIEATKDQAETFATSFINNVKTKKGGKF